MEKMMQYIHHLERENERSLRRISQYESLKQSYKEKKTKKKGGSVNNDFRNGNKHFYSNCEEFEEQQDMW